MIRLTVLYPASEDARFDHDYYVGSHVPLAASTWGVERYEVDKGIDGPHVAAVHFFFGSMEEMGAALAVEGTAAVQADVANYTDITPVMQISETT